MARRTKTPRSTTAKSLSGRLGDALERHVMRRADHFFMFLFFLQGACDLVRARTGDDFRPRDIVGSAATHQIDVGLIELGSAKISMPGTPPSSIRRLPVSPRSTPHISGNIGLAGPFARLKARAQTDPDATYLIDVCETLAGDTVWLPKQVNIGPDKVIDRLHYALAIDILTDGRPVLDAWRLRDYAGRAQQAMMNYVVVERGKAEQSTARPNVASATSEPAMCSSSRSPTRSRRRSTRNAVPGPRSGAVSRLKSLRPDCALSSSLTVLEGSRPVGNDPVPIRVYRVMWSARLPSGSCLPSRRAGPRSSSRSSRSSCACCGRCSSRFSGCPRS